MLKPLRFLALLAACAMVAPTFGQPYPNHPVKIVVAFAAGSATDILARIIGDEFRAAFGQPFIV